MAFKKTFSNITQLGTELNGQIRIAQRKTLERLLSDLKKDYIMKEVYGASGSSKYGRIMGKNKGFNEDRTRYTPTGDLLRAFEVTDVYTRNRGGGSYQTYGGIAPSNHDDWTVDRDNYIHYSLDSKFGSLNSYELAMIINNGLGDKSIIEKMEEPRPFWDDFLKYANENYARIFKEECSSLGINLNGGITSVGTRNQYQGASEGGTIVKF